jgi:hypothetical protein
MDSKRGVNVASANEMSVKPRPPKGLSSKIRRRSADRGGSLPLKPVIFSEEIACANLNVAVKLIKNTRVPVLLLQPDWNAAI